MIFDNRNIIIKLNKRRYILVLLYVTLMAVLFFSGLFQDRFKAILAILFSFLYIVYNIITYYLNFSYFSYRDDSEYLMFRFVSMRTFDNDKKAINISKLDFVGFKFEKLFFGYKQNLILRIRTKKGSANYPPISISALSQKHLKMLEQSLNQFA
ncbi:MAG: hypothetical protein C0597_15530 [Marinilabiliales bacterium]|nr:MAG: hypothetical protein C0597_15530 [Marinilabiliales bacterium]